MNSTTKQGRSPEDAAFFLGISVQPKTLPELNSLVAAMIEEKEKCVIANHNLHSLYLFHKLPQFRRFYRKARWAHIDGMPFVALARLSATLLIARTELPCGLGRPSYANCF